uniref:SAP30-binding protein n=1 Tax=Rhizophora mucronata TaxID=61149 RepID=A0A2P2K2B4_RHIMU
MASRKKPSEGIALLSMYGDEDDEDMEDVDEQQQQQQPPPTEHEEHEQTKPSGENEDWERGDSETDATMVTDEFGGEATPPVAYQDSSAKEGLTPPQRQPLEERQRQGNSQTKGSGRGRVTIVDYAHDEVAMSPEPEEGEFAEGLQLADGQTPSGTVQVLSPSVQAASQSEQLESSQPFEMGNASVQSEAIADKGTGEDPVEVVDPLDKFLPPAPKENCPEELQRKIDKFLSLKKIGRSFNAEVRNKKDYRNPDFLLHAVRYQDIDQIGTCFSKDVFDPHGYEQSDYYLDIEADMRRERERKEQELKKSPKVEFVSGGTQPGMVVPPSKFSVPIPVPSSGLQSTQPAPDAAGRDGRQNKKSKWDKVDGDGRNPLTGGQDSLASVTAHAALLSAAGAGYSAFVQQKRREAEEKRSTERKLDRRS